uniref:Protein kinase domain-containing protein n=1 Tax=Oryza barthii TaxID=65489 RepID=A0A0D3GIU0_9ORYZ
MPPGARARRIAALDLIFLVFLRLASAYQRPSDAHIDCIDIFCLGGYTCSETTATTSCTAYLTFRSDPPLYSSPLSVAYLLNATASAVAAANSVPLAVSPVDGTQLLLVPVPCSCNRATGYYQHNTTYTVQEGDSFFCISNGTFQGLTTYQSIIANNPASEAMSPVINDSLVVPLRCACPSATTGRISNLLTYVVQEGDNVTSIARRFNSTHGDVLAANNLSSNASLFPFNTLLVPLVHPPHSRLVLANTTITSTTPPESQKFYVSSPCSNGLLAGLGIGVGCGVSAWAAVLAVFLLWRRRRRRPVGDSSGMARETPLVAAVRGAVETLAAYSYADIETATAGFAEERRVAAGSSVYRAVINGESFAVKRVAAGGDDVRGEVDVLGRVNHSGLVRLRGLCANGDDTYLVLEFAENGALSEWLHPGSAAACLRRVLGWKQRVLVALDVAGGLNYLHHFTNPPYVHKNLNSGNVLLDANLRAKVSSLGFARAVAVAVAAGDDSIALMTHHVVGTHGYLAPEYLEHGLISPKLDVFSFGVILLELLSGKTAAFVTDDDGQSTLLWQAADRLVDGDGAWLKLRAFMDPQLQGHYPIGVASAVAALAVRCVAREPRARPSMEEVFVTLSAVYNLTVDWDPQNYSASASMVLGR